VEQLLNENCDLILFSSTSSDRIEVRGTDAIIKTYPTVFDLDYYDSPDKSNNDKRFLKSPKIYSQSIINILKENIVDYKKTNIIKSWFLYCYSEEIKALQDACIVYSTLSMLENTKTDYYFLHWEVDMMSNKLFSLPLINNTRLIDSRMPELSCHTWEDYCYNDRGLSRRWHTTDESQAKGAQAWIKFLENNGYTNSNYA
jgi:hypothetical protein